LTIEQVLWIYLICFNAAANAAPPYLLAYAQHVRHPGVELPVWQVWTVNDLHNPPEDHSKISFAPEWLPDALVKKDLCDHFALLFEDEVHQKLQADFGARARWIQYFPIIDFILATFDSDHQLEKPLHSALVIQQPNGINMVFDGSLEQFGWRKETWLQSEADFLATRLDQTEDPCWEYASDQTRSETREAMLHADGGLWEQLRIRMEELFGELEWDKLKETGHEQRTAAVKAQAEAKF
ncbi:hypothetical protein T440DRAFT_376589, partial [Plenodomus tracheiphilus IPT5]